LLVRRQTIPSGSDQLVIGRGKELVLVVDGSCKVLLISDKYKILPREKPVIPFRAGNLARPPKLAISFVARTRGYCRQSYENIEIIMNHMLVQSIDFR
jgi:hypothetical protein